MGLSLEWDRSICWLVNDVNGLPNQFPEVTKGSTPINVLLLGTGAFVAYEMISLDWTGKRSIKMDGYSVARPILKTGLIGAGVLAMVDGADRKEPGMVAGGAGILALTSLFYPSASLKVKQDIDDTGGALRGLRNLLEDRIQDIENLLSDPKFSSREYSGWNPYYQSRLEAQLENEMRS